MKNYFVCCLCFILFLFSSAFVYGDANANEALALHELGFFDGLSDKAFVPGLELKTTREQAMKILITALNVEVDLSKISGFSDVSTWAEPYVAKAIELGITSGKGANRFGANDTLTSKELGTWVLRSLGSDPQEAWSNTKMELENFRLDIQSDDKLICNRGMLVNAVYQMLLADPKNSFMSLIEEFLVQNPDKIKTAKSYGLCQIEFDDICYLDATTYDGDYGHILRFKNKYLDVGDKVYDFFNFEGILRLVPFVSEGIHEKTIDIGISDDLKNWKMISGTDQQTLKGGQKNVLGVVLNSELVLMSKDQVFKSKDGIKFTEYQYKVKGYDKSFFSIYDGPFPYGIHENMHDGSYIVHNGYLYTYSQTATFTRSLVNFGTSYKDMATHELIMRTNNGVDWEVVYYNVNPLVVQNSSIKVAEFFDVEGKICLLAIDRLLSSENGRTWKEDKTHALVEYINNYPFKGVGREYSYDIFESTGKNVYLTFTNVYVPDVHYHEGTYFISDRDISVTTGTSYNYDDVVEKRWGLFITKNFKDVINVKHKYSNLHLRLRFVLDDNGKLLTNYGDFDYNKIEGFFNAFDQKYTEILIKKQAESASSKLLYTENNMDALNDLMMKEQNLYDLEALNLKLFGEDKSSGNGSIGYGLSDQVVSINTLIYNYDFGQVSYAEKAPGQYLLEEIRCWSSGFSVGGIEVGQPLSTDTISKYKLRTSGNGQYYGDFNNDISILINVENNVVTYISLIRSMYFLVD